MDSKEIDNYLKIYEAMLKLSMDDEDGVDSWVKAYNEADMIKFFDLQRDYNMAKMGGSNKTFKEFLEAK